MIKIKAGYKPNENDVVTDYWVTDGDLILQFSNRVAKVTRLERVQDNLTKEEEDLLLLFK